MALTYCEVCGVLIKGGGAELPEGVICGECFSSRQVMVESDSELVMAQPAAPAPAEKVQFACPYCSAVLRVAVPEGERTHVRCPRCTETFFAQSDGTVAARMEGGTTQVLLQDEVLSKLKKGPDGTQPMRSLEATPAQGNSGTRALRALQPPGGDLGAPQVIQPPSSDSGSLQLLPTDAPRVAPVQAAPPSSLRASDEGKINFDTQALKAKTQRFGDKGQQGTQRLGTGGTKRLGTGGTKRLGTGGTKRLGTGAEKTKGKKGGDTDRLPRPEPAPEELVAKKKGKVPKGKKASERFRNVSSGAIKRAVNRAEELEAEGQRRVLKGAFAWGFVLLPTLVFGFFAGLVSRDAGLVKAEKPVGQFLQKAGRQADRAVREINELLPLEARVPGVTSQRKAGVAAETSAR